MKIVFFGSSDFAIPSLEKLVKYDYEILGIVTQPDRKRGRHLLLEMTPVKQFAIKRNLRILQPGKLNESEFMNSLRELKADVFIVIAYGKILTKEMLSFPKIFSINVHGSLLPKYRGAAPINWAIVNGEKTTGVTIIKMNEFMDKGDIILQKEVDITKEDTAITLSEKLAVIGSDMLIEVLRMMQKDKLAFTMQDEMKASYAPQLKKEDGLINWNQPALNIHNRIRGLIPWPGSFTYYKDKILKIWKAQFIKSDLEIGQPGEIIDISKEAIVIATAKDTLRIEELQLESAKRMNVADFIAGHKLSITDKLG